MLTADKLVPSVELYKALGSRSDTCWPSKAPRFAFEVENGRSKDTIPAIRAELGRILHQNEKECLAL